jgi:hypothetical protein
MPLTFTFIVMDGHGQFSTRFSLQSPSGRELIAQEALSDSNKPVGEVLTAAILIQPFTTEEVGEFAVTLHLGEASFRRTFTLAFAP